MTIAGVMTKKCWMLKGGPGSGHYGHRGRVGWRGGSQPCCGQRRGLFDLPPLPVIASQHRVLPSERLSAAAARAKQKILADFGQRGVRNRDQNVWIAASGNYAGHAVHLGEKHQPLYAHMEAAFVAASLLRHAVLGERYLDKKDNNLTLYVARYFAPFWQDETLYRVKMTVFEQRDPKDRWTRFYDHRLTELEKVNPLTGWASSAHPLADKRPLGVSGLKISIDQLLAGATRDGDRLPFAPDDGAPLTKAWPLPPGALIVFFRRRSCPA